MTRTPHRLLLAGGLVAAAVGLAGTSASAQGAKPKFDTYDNDKHGFSLTYPADKFVALPQSSPDGWQAVSRDGNARLLVGTIANFDGKSLTEYRAFLLNAAYPGAKIDYAPVRDTWFVVSGVRKDGITAFYQRVNFVCGGRNINSWAVIFPYGQEPVYSRIIDQIHRDYAVGDGNCAKTTMEPKRVGAAEPSMQSKQMGAMERMMTAGMDPMTQPMTQPKATGAMEPAMPPKAVGTMDPAMPAMAVGGTGMAAGLTTYGNEKHGYSLTYPTAQFLALPPSTPDVFQAVSKDGKARLQAGTLANFDGKSLGGYRSFLLNAAYPGARLGDAPMRDTGFVLSGVKSDGTTAFYHRVSFVCGWRNINSWSLLYPAQEQATYARIIEQVDRDYAVGDGNCAKTTMTESMAQPGAVAAQPGAMATK
ncbi:MAG TPA: hypothetical protein VH913_04090 [Hyphomicrobiaceae bacterium]|jgi:hypothetical protein